MMWDLVAPEKLGLWIGIIANFIELAGLTIAGLAGLVIWRQRRRNVFKTKVSCTLNVLEMRDDGLWFVLRGLYGGSIANVIQEPSTRRAFMANVGLCTTANPFVTVVTEKIRERIIESFVMFLSTYPGIEQKLMTFLRLHRLAGLTLIGVPTFEVFRDSRDHKIRPWYITLDHLRILADGGELKLKFESPDHEDRIKWLRTMAEIVIFGTTNRLRPHEVVRVRKMIHRVIF